jgi:hypothetical protein
MIVWGSLTAALTFGVLASREAAAQGISVTPSVTTTEVYDSNLFFSPTNREADSITRITPAFDIAYRSTRATLLARSALDIERFAEHPELTRAAAGERAATDLSVKATARLTLSAGADFLRTQTPGELNTVAGLAFPRAWAERVGARMSATRQFDPTSTGTLAYAISDDRLQGGLEVRTQDVALTSERRVSPRDSVVVRGRIDEWSFSVPTSSPTAVLSYLVSAGWKRSLTEHFSFLFVSGPRITNASLMADVDASLAYHRRPMDFSIGYARTQTAVLGLSGAADVESLTTAVAVTTRSEMTVRLVPRIFRTMAPGVRATAARMIGQLERPIVSGLSATVMVDTSVQTGNLYSGVASGTIPRRLVMLGLVVRARKPHEVAHAR